MERPAVPFPPPNGHPYEPGHALRVSERGRASRFLFQPVFPPVRARGPVFPILGSSHGDGDGDGVRGGDRLRRPRRAPFGG